MIWVQWRVCRHFLVTAHPAWPLTWTSDTVTEWKLPLETDILVARLSPNWSIKTRNCPLCPWAGMTEPPQDPASPLAGGRTEKVRTRSHPGDKTWCRGVAEARPICRPSAFPQATYLWQISVHSASSEQTWRFSAAEHKRVVRIILHFEKVGMLGHVTPKFCFLFLSPCNSTGTDIIRSRVPLHSSPCCFFW